MVTMWGEGADSLALPRIAACENQVAGAIQSTPGRVPVTANLGDLGP